MRMVVKVVCEELVSFSRKKQEHILVSVMPCTFVSRSHDRAADEARDASAQCAICLEPYESDAACVTLPCSHKFHGQCCVRHFWSGRVNCPLCRSAPDDSYDEDSDSDSDARLAVNHDRRNRARLLAKARRMAKTDKKMARRFATIDKWTRVSTEHNAISKALDEKLRPIEDALDKRIKQYTDKLEAQHDAKYGSLRAAYHTAKKTARTAQGRARASRRMLVRQMMANESGFN